MNDKRRQQADEKYRRQFFELGLDENFEYIGFEKKDHIWIRCKRCGVEASRGNDVFKGRQSKLLCRKCGNGMKKYSPEVDEILDYYTAGHTVTETSQKFGITKAAVNNWVKLRRATNGRTFEQGATESNKKRAEEAGWPGSKYKLSHYSRAKMRGLPAEEGITLKKIIERDGLNCAICGLVCIYGGDSLAPLYPSIDHIVPISKGGGHTWENVQLAHRLCNIRKSNLVGKEWNNGND